MSATSPSGLVGLSAKSIFVSGRIASDQARMSATSTNVVLMPNGGSTFANSDMVVPNRPSAATTWSPPRSSAIAVMKIAAMPDAVAMQLRPPSRAARRPSNARTVGFVNRE